MTTLENTLRQELKDAINKVLTDNAQQVKDLNQDDRMLWVKVYGKLFGVVCDLIYGDQAVLNGNEKFNIIKKTYNDQRIATLIVQEVRDHFPDLAIVFGRHAIDKQQWIKG